jgi:hypothetical protein
MEQSPSSVSQIVTKFPAFYETQRFIPVFMRPGLWSRYTKPQTPTLIPQFLELRLRLLHESSICIKNGKPIRHFINTR